MKIEVKDKALFDLFVLTILIIVIITSFQYEWAASQFPLLFAIPLAVLFAFQLMIDLLPNTPKILNFMNAKGLFSSEEKANKENMTSWLAVVRVIMYWIFFLVFLNFTNYLIAGAVFVFLFCKFEARISYLKSLLIACGTVICVYLVFTMFLGIRL